MATTVVIIHPRELLRAGLAAVLKTDRAVRVVGQGSSGKDALRLQKQHSVDVILLYDQLEHEDSFDVAKRFGQMSLSSKVVMIGVEANPTAMARSIAAGVHGYVTEGSSGREICEAIRSAGLGKVSTPSGSFGAVVKSLSSTDTHMGVNLTPREFQTLRHIGYGLANLEIASCMAISVETVKEHVQNVLRKLGARDRTQAAVWAIQKGLL